MSSNLDPGDVLEKILPDDYTIDSNINDQRRLLVNKEIKDTIDNEVDIYPPNIINYYMGNYYGLPDIQKNSLFQNKGIKIGVVASYFFKKLGFYSNDIINYCSTIFKYNNDLINKNIKL
jgi:hypothetical protein